MHAVARRVPVYKEHGIRAHRLVEALSGGELLEGKAVTAQRSFQLPIWKNPPQEHRQWQCHLSSAEHISLGNRKKRGHGGGLSLPHHTETSFLYPVPSPPLLTFK